MITPHPQTTRVASQTKHVHPSAHKTGPSQTSEVPDVLTVIRDNLAFLKRIHHIIGARTRAGHIGR